MSRLADDLLINEEFFNAANDQLAERIERLGPPVPDDLMVSLYCECADTECQEAIEIAIKEYKEIHRDPMAFMVLPEHTWPRFETVTKREKNYWIVRKIEERLSDDVRRQAEKRDKQ